MLAFEKTWEKAWAITTSETISLMNQCVCLDEDLPQVTHRDLSQVVAHLGCSTIAGAQVKLHWNRETWQQHPSLCHRFLASISSAVFQNCGLFWTKIGDPRGQRANPTSRVSEKPQKEEKQSKCNDQHELTYLGSGCVFEIRTSRRSR